MSDANDRKDANAPKDGDAPRKGGFGAFADKYRDAWQTGHPKPVRPDAGAASKPAPTPDAPSEPSAPSDPPTKP